MIVSLILAVVFTILAVFFASYNQGVIAVNFFGYKVQGTVGLIMVIAWGIGVLVGALVMLPSVLSRSWALMRHKRKLQELQTASQTGTIDTTDSSDTDGG